MADPLSLLRTYNMQRKTIIERDGQVIFGEFSWPKTVNTNYIQWGTGKAGTAKRYYTLECLLYLLKNITLQHPVYVRQAAAEGVPIVMRPDRKDLLGYLKGELATCPSIDKSAPLEMPTQVKRTADSDLSDVAQKKPRYDEGASQKLKNQFAQKYGVVDQSDPSHQGPNIRDLSDELNKNKLAEIKKKIEINRRNRIKVDEGDKGLASFADIEVDRTKEIFSRERQWRTRSTILQSSGKQFSKNILAILTSVKAREEGRYSSSSGKPAPPAVMTQHPPVSGHQRPAPPTRQPMPGYNRYEQDKYQQAETEGFKIDTTGTYAGKTLKSVMDTAGSKHGVRPAAASSASAVNNSVPRPLSTQQQQSGKGGKRVSRTPIIIIPAAPKSLITMFNAKDLLQDLRFISTEDKRGAGAKRENDVLIQRRKEGNLTVPYRVLDNPTRLTNAEWDRVVAVFVMGQTWQFKGWPNEGRPVDILSRIAGFHLKMEEQALEKNIASWAVSIIQLNKNKRHLDRAAMLSFWEKLDKHMVKSKPHLRF